MIGALRISLRLIRDSMKLSRINLDTSSQKNVIIIGAGAMGSAFSVPCVDKLHEVFLVGSILEDELINEINKLNNFHPILKCQLPKKVNVIKFSELNNGISNNIDLLVVGVSSKGIDWIGEEISRFYSDKTNILLLQT